MIIAKKVDRISMNPKGSNIYNNRQAVENTTPTGSQNCGISVFINIQSLRDKKQKCSSMNPKSSNDYSKSEKNPKDSNGYSIRHTVDISTPSGSYNCI